MAMLEILVVGRASCEREGSYRTCRKACWPCEQTGTLASVHRGGTGLLFLHTMLPGRRVRIDSVLIDAG